MCQNFRYSVIVWAVLAVFVPVLSFAQDSADSDTREVTTYVLTERGLQQFTEASQNLGSLARELAGDCNEDDDSEDAQSLDDMVARMDAIPGATAAIESAGMSNREYIVFSLSMMQNGMAAWAVSQPGAELPPNVSMANVEFYKAHEAEIQKLGAGMESGDCDGEDQDSDEEEE